MSVEQVMLMLKEHEVKFIDFRFTSTTGKEHHVSIPVSTDQEEINSLFKTGKMFDGSSIKGWKSVDESDMLLMPDISSVVLDPFSKEPMLIVRCDVFDPKTMQNYDRDPRSIAKRAEKFLMLSGIADQALFGPEPEFFLFDDIHFNILDSGSCVSIKEKEAAWYNSTNCRCGGNKGYLSSMHNSYFAVPPTDSSQDFRSAVCSIMADMGLIVEAHHHEVATAGQNEVATRFDTLTKKADEIQVYKYVVHNIAYKFGKTATFMPKPIFGDNGSGMHCHMSLNKSGANLFAGNKYGGLSEMALFYIGGIIKHIKTINAFTNPTTNSYKRLVPGYEAPVVLAYSSGNRSAAIRIPIVSSHQKRRVEARFPDPAANPYLAFPALLMAGIDGILHRISPGDAIDKNLYKLSSQESRKTKTVASSLEEALNFLDLDRNFLTRGGVFTNDAIDAYIALRREENDRVQMQPHPMEFKLYYNV